MAETPDPEGLSSIIACREAEVGRSLKRYGRAETAAAANGTFMSALVFASGGVVAALHPHLGIATIVLVASGGALTIVSMLVAALSWNPTTTRGAIAQKAAKVLKGPFASDEVLSSSRTLAESVSFDGSADHASVQQRTVLGLEAKITAADRLAGWSERRTGALGFMNTTAFLLVATGAVVALAQR